MYIPKSLWGPVLEKVSKFAGEVKMGDVMDHQNYINAVIDEASFDNIASYIEYAKNSKDAKIVLGGKYDKSVGYFVEPTIIETTDPHFKSMEEEILFILTMTTRWKRLSSFVTPHRHTVSQVLSSVRIASQ